VEEGQLTLRRRAAALLAAALAIGAEIAAPAGAPWPALLDAAVALAFAGGAAAVAFASPRVADLAIAIAATWALGTLAAGGDLPDELILLHRVPLAVLVVTYPGRRLQSAPAVAIGLAAVAATLAPADAGAAATTAVVGVAALAAAAGAARTAPVLRAPRAAAAVAGTAITATAAAGVADLGDATALLIAYEAVLLATAAGLLGLLATGRWKAAAASGLALELGAAPAGAPITAGLADALRDPGLELRMRLPGAEWADEAGRAAPEPQARDRGRAITRRVLGDGTELALLHDPAAIADRAAAESAVAVAAVAVDNARHERQVHERIEHLQRLRRGLLEAADEERRALEDELRLGPLREADRLDELLGTLPGEQASAQRRELAVARGELTEIARGLYPQALARDGLAATLSDAAARSPVPVDVHADVDGTSVPEPIALTAYYVATEALTNVAKHAHARHARLELTAGEDGLLVRVADDGIGGADPVGGGLRGLRDRVATVNGELRVLSPRGGGTVVEARLPLGAGGTGHGEGQPSGHEPA
jgi:hypothetical protein